MTARTICSAKIARTEASVHDLGRAVGGDDKVLGELLPELVASEGQLWPFGRGLYAGTKNPVVVWGRLTDALSVVPLNGQRIQVLSGFLYELNLHDPMLANTLLDDAVSHEALGVWYPMLQTVTRLDEQGVTRVLRSLAVGKAPIDMYRSLGGGRATEPLSGEQVKRLVLAIAEKGGGYDIAADILSMRLHSDHEQKQPIPRDIVDAGCALLISSRLAGPTPTRSTTWSRLSSPVSLATRARRL